MPDAAPMHTPFNIKVMDVDTYIRNHATQPVTSMFIHEPSSVDFHADGLFSEDIFGAIGTDQRMITLGYVELNTQIIAPVIYKSLVKLSALYEEILAGRVYARFDEESKEFVRVIGDPELVEGADTGFSFFMSHFLKMELPSTGSTARENRIELIRRYKEIALYKRSLVLPAGLRDLESDGDRMVQDDINKLYTSLIAYTLAIPEGATSPLYDSIRFKIQQKTVEIYNYIENILTGKRGFFQGGGYGRRKIQLGTRNVITSADYVMETPDDPQALKPNETKTGLFQTSKGLQPVVSYYMRSAFFDPILGEGDSAKIALTNPKTLTLEYVEVSARERAKFDRSEAIETWTNRMRNADVRTSPITIQGENGQSYYLALVYDWGDSVSLFRSVSDLEAQFKDAGRDYELSNIRPLTWVEAFYMATYNAAKGRHCMITRYPVIEEGSCYPSRIHLMTTSPARVVKLHDLITNSDTIEYPQYPVLKDSVFLDSTVVHSEKLPGLGADYDGDMVSVNFVMSDDSNAEIASYLEDSRAFMTPEGNFLTGGLSDLIKLMFINMTGGGSLSK